MLSRSRAVQASHVHKHRIKLDISKSIHWRQLFHTCTRAIYYDAICTSKILNKNKSLFSMIAENNSNSCSSGRLEMPQQPVHGTTSFWNDQQNWEIGIESGLSIQGTIAQLMHSSLLIQDNPIVHLNCCIQSQISVQALLQVHWNHIAKQLKVQPNSNAHDVPRGNNLWGLEQTKRKVMSLPQKAVSNFTARQ